MAHFLRDQLIINVSVNEDILEEINKLFVAGTNTLNVTSVNSNPEKAFLSYIIRFDGKGYRVFTIEDLLEYFRQAKEIERIIFTLETWESISSMRQNGGCMELKFDQKDPNGSSLIVTSNDENWVRTSFLAIQDILSKCKNKHGWMRTSWTPLGVQIMGVFFGFVLSLLAAIKISPKLSMDNSFVICFFFVLLIFSNTWTYLNQLILSLVNSSFPSIKFYRPDKEYTPWWQKIINAIVWASIIGFIGWILKSIFSYALSILNEFVVKTPQ